MAAGLNLCVLASQPVGDGVAFSPASLSSRRKFPESSGHDLHFSTEALESGV